MIPAQHHQLQHKVNGGFAKRAIDPESRNWVWSLVRDPLAASKWPLDHIRLAMARNVSGIAFDRFNIVPFPSCGCCGTPYYGPSALRKVVDSPPIWRCEKHLGRAPCCIEGCGRTFALGEYGYDVTFICGRHWRQAPKYMRDRVARLRKKAVKLHWPDRLGRLYDQAFNLAVRAVHEGRTLDMAAINKEFGWD